MIERNWRINGVDQTLRFQDAARLIDVLREKLGLTGPKEGCGEGECGACSILVDNRLSLACLTLAASLPDGVHLLTVEGLAKQTLGRQLQNAFLEYGAVQCGYCTPGMLMAAYALLQENPNPDAEAISRAISGNLCRCTGYQMIVEAILSCAEHPEKGAS